MMRSLCIVVALAVTAGPAAAAERSVTLERIAKTGRITLGFVPDAPPMSFLDAEGTPVGYSIELCKRIVVAVQDKLGLPKLNVKYVPLIAPEERIRAVEKGAIDIECGATTNTLSRRERVDFTLMTFITGGAVLSTKASPIPNINALAGKTLAVIPGTTTRSTLEAFRDINEFEITLRDIQSHAEGMKLLAAGQVDGYASDRAMLIGQVLRSPDADKYTITRDVFSFEPYALMIRRGDTDFRLLADRALAKLYHSARIRRLYHDWFGKYGEKLSPVVEAMYEFQAVGE